MSPRHGPSLPGQLGALLVMIACNLAVLGVLYGGLAVAFWCAS
jgi:hypothetical protein